VITCGKYKFEILCQIQKNSEKFRKTPTANSQLLIIELLFFLVRRHPLCFLPPCHKRSWSPTLHWSDETLILRLDYQRSRKCRAMTRTSTFSVMRQFPFKLSRHFLLKKILLFSFFSPSSFLFSLWSPFFNVLTPIFFLLFLTPCMKNNKKFIYKKNAGQRD
jgi:hypothetical protein